MENKVQPLVSILMNCYNGEKYLREAIDSVYAQTYENWEIIFWDNASTDNSEKIAQSYGSKLRYFKGSKTITLGAARNKAIEQCNGDLIAFLDVDDFWLPNKLMAQIRMFINYDDVGIVIGNVIERRVNYGDKIKYSKKSLPPEGFVYNELLKDYYINIATVVIKVDVLDLMEYVFDTRYNMIEEFDLFLRMAFITKIKYVDEIVAVYRIHSNNFSTKYFYDYAYELEIFIEENKSNIYKNGGKQLFNVLKKKLIKEQLISCIKDKNFRSNNIIKLPWSHRFFVYLLSPFPLSFIYAIYIKIRYNY
jgi:glycosyltransferase involved in cell wall biosynthesis